MIEAHVFSYGQRHLYAEEWDQWLHLRHQVYIEEKRWHEPNADRRETDQFDNDAATYILGLLDGKVVTSARLIPCHKPTLVSDVFPHFCERGGVPDRPDWIEWTRTLTVPELRSGGRQSILTQLCAAVMEYCLLEGAAKVGGIQELFFLPKWKHLGWKTTPLGLPQEIEGSGDCVVAFMDVNETALANIRSAMGTDRSLLHHRGQRPRLIDEERLELSR